MCKRRKGKKRAREKKTNGDRERKTVIEMENPQHSVFMPDRVLFEPKTNSSARTETDIWACAEACGRGLVRGGGRALSMNSLVS